VKIALADREPKLTAVGWVPDQPEGPPKPALVVQDPILTAIVKDAARRLDRTHQPTIVDARLDGDGGGDADALLWVYGTAPTEELHSLWPGVPAAAVFQGEAVPRIDGVDLLDLSHTRRRAATTIVHRWLASSSAFVSAAELRKLSALLSDVHAALESRLPATLPFLNSMQAIEVELTAPRKSRRVVAMALEHIATHAGSVAPNEALAFLPELLDLFPIGPSAAAAPMNEPSPWSDPNVGDV
jgi:hypothetical protein